MTRAPAATLRAEHGPVILIAALAYLAAAQQAAPGTPGEAIRKVLHANAAQ